MQSVGMRSVRRFFRNATKTQKKVQKNAKKVLSLKKERTCQKWRLLSKRRRKKHLAESAAEKKDVGFDIAEINRH